MEGLGLFLGHRSMFAVKNSGQFRQQDIGRVQFAHEYINYRKCSDRFVPATQQHDYGCVWPQVFHLGRYPTVYLSEEVVEYHCVNRL